MMWLVVIGFLLFVGYSISEFIDSIGNERMRRRHEKSRKD